MGFCLQLIVVLMSLFITALPGRRETLKVHACLVQIIFFLRRGSTQCGRKSQPFFADGQGFQQCCV